MPSISLICRYLVKSSSLFCTLLSLLPLIAMEEEEKKEEPMTLSNQEITPIPLYLDKEETQPRLTFRKVPSTYIPSCCSAKGKASEPLVLLHVDQKEPPANLSVLFFLREVFQELAPYLYADSKRKYFFTQNHIQNLAQRLRNSREPILALMYFFEMLPPKPNTFLTQFFDHVETTASGEKRRVTFGVEGKYQTQYFPSDQEDLYKKNALSNHKYNFIALDGWITRGEGNVSETFETYAFLYYYFTGMLLNNLELYFEPEAYYALFNFFLFDEVCFPFAFQDMLFWTYKIGQGLFIAKQGLYYYYEGKEPFVPFLLGLSYISTPIWIIKMDIKHEYPNYYLNLMFQLCHLFFCITSNCCFFSYFDRLRDIFFPIENSALFSRMKILANLEKKISHIKATKEAIFTANQKIPKPIAQTIYTYYAEKAHDWKDCSLEITPLIKQYYADVAFASPSPNAPHPWEWYYTPSLLLLFLFHIILFGGSFYKTISCT